jgi:hypothetical protein
MASTHKTLVMGFWLDDVSSVYGEVPPNPVGNVAHNVAELVIGKINRNFGLDPPLALNDNDMGIAWIPGMYEFSNILLAQLTI